MPAISYTISHNGTEFELASKITTINSSNYNLLDAHYIDWDSTAMTWFNSIPSDAIKMFSYLDGVNNQVPMEPLDNAAIMALVDNRKRYVDDKLYPNVLKKEGAYPPAWGPSSIAPGKLDTTLTLADILDYFAFITSFNYTRIKSLFDIQNSVTPILVLRDKDFKIFDGVYVESGGNIGDQDRNNIIKFYLKPNQLNVKYKNVVGTIFTNVDNARSFRIYMVVMNQYNENITTRSLYYRIYDKDNPDNSESNVNLIYSGDLRTTSSQSITEAIGFKKGFTWSQSQTSDESRYGFTVDVLVRGWNPIEERQAIDSLPRKWNDSGRGTFIFKTGAKDGLGNNDDTFNESLPRSIVMEVHKDPNYFTHIFINETLYYFIPAGFLGENFNIPYLIRADKCKAVVDLDNFNKEKMIPEDFESVIIPCSPTNDNISATKAMQVANGKDITFEIYPKYFNPDAIEDKDSNIIYNSLYDQDDSNDAGGVPFANIKSVLNVSGESKFSNVTLVTRKINGIERKGFKYKINITHKTNDNQGGDTVRYTFVSIGITPTKYVGGLDLRLKLVGVPVKNVIFIDNRRKFSESNLEVGDYKSKQNDPLTFLEGDFNYGVTESVLKKDDESDRYIWDLKLPIFTSRSWGVKDNSNYSFIYSTYINPATLSTIKEKNELVPPMGSVEFDKISSVKTLNSEYMLVEDANDSQLDEKYYSDFINKDSKYKCGFPILQISGFPKENDPTSFLISSASYEQKFDNDSHLYYTCDFSISNKIVIDYRETYIVNKILIDELIKNGHEPILDKKFKEVDNDITLNDGAEKETEKGKYFCSKYFAIAANKDDSVSGGGIKYKYLFMYHPTVPSNFENTNYEYNYLYEKGIDKFTLVLCIPESLSATENASDILYEEAKLYVNILVSRADNNLAGWTAKADTGSGSAGVVAKISVDTVYSLNQLVDSAPFSSTQDVTGAKTNHNIQTRLTTKFIPLNNSRYNEIKHTATSDADSDAIYYYEILENNSGIKFYDHNVNDKSWKPTPYYKIDDNYLFQLYGFMDSDEWFKGFYKETDSMKYINIKIARKLNNIVRLRGTNDDSGALDTGWYNNNSKGWKFIAPPQALTFDSETVGATSSIERNISSVSELTSEINFFLEFLYWVGNQADINPSGTTLNIIYKDYCERPNIFVCHNNDYDIGRLSITACLCSNEDGSDALEKVESFKNVWNTSISVDGMGSIIRKEPNDVLPTTGNYNKFYIADEGGAVRDLKDYISIYYKLPGGSDIDENSKTKQIGGFFVPTDKLVGLVQSSNKYKSLLMRVVGILPMTSEYKGYCYDCKIIYKLNL